MLSIPSAYLDNVAPFSTIRFIRLYSHISMEFINASIDHGLSGVECEPEKFLFSQYSKPFFT